MCYNGVMAKETTQRVVLVYETDNGQRPFWDWFEGIKDRKIRLRISRYIDRFESGNLGDHKSVGEGVMEMRLFFWIRLSYLFCRVWK